MGVMTAGKTGRQGKAKRRDKQRDGDAACRSCGERNQAGARFCQNCGRSLAGGDRFNAQLLTVIGAAVLTLAALGLLFASVLDTGSPSGASPTARAPSRTASAASGQPPDLSTMSPREAADRLFNRVMMADEQGNADEVAQFAPMAVAAYDRLEDLDPDALYHVGLIQTAMGDASSAWDTVERLRTIVPKHLLASLLEHRLATEANETERAERAVERFKASYDEEIKIDRLEYRDHQRSIDQFREQIGAAESEGG